MNSTPRCNCKNCQFTRDAGGYMPCLVQSKPEGLSTEVLLGLRRAVDEDLRRQGVRIPNTDSNPREELLQAIRDDFLTSGQFDPAPLARCLVAWIGAPVFWLYVYPCLWVIVRIAAGGPGLRELRRCLPRAWLSWATFGRLGRAPE